MTDNETKRHLGRSADLRSRLIREAEGILERDGLDALTLRGIARAAGVSHMAPYRHFDDKDALLAAVAESGFRQLGAAMGGDIGGLAAKDRLQMIGVGYIRFAREHPALYRLMFGPAKPDSTRFPELAEASRAAFACCARAVDARVSGSPTGSAAEALTVATWSLVHGLASLMIDGRLPQARSPDVENALIEQVLMVFGRVFPPIPGA